MSEPRTDPLMDPTGYVRREVWPPLPAVFGGWLAELTHRATAGADPATELAVPDAILETGLAIPGAHLAPDGTPVIALVDALTLFHLEHLLYPDDDTEGSSLAIFEPLVALQLANTADATTVSETYNPATVRELSAQITAGEYDYRTNETVTLDTQGRLTHGLNLLLAIVHANAPAPALALYHYDTNPGPYRWRGPAGFTQKAPHDD
ncbi:hypothetical protein ACFPC0_10690 [Streptomyces andamanensis]|uniref:Gluconate 2-dehydrogenase subunit 3 family protein n=1 Tax=Streptomyces andamanensis TaxID=1565035 RepID=A0ABV8TCJ6_9ACTN